METVAIVLEGLKIAAAITAAGAAAVVAIRNSDRALQVSKDQAETQRKQAEIADGQANIAKVQAMNTQMKLRLDLFERRFEVYHLTFEVLEILRLQNKPDWMVRTGDVTGVLLQGMFLFGADVRKPLLEIMTTAHHAQSVVDDTAKKAAIAAWAEKMQVEIEAIFAPYLSFGDVARVPLGKI